MLSIMSPRLVLLLVPGFGVFVNRLFLVQLAVDRLPHQTLKSTF